MHNDCTYFMLKPKIKILKYILRAKYPPPPCPVPSPSHALALFVLIKKVNKL